MSSAARPKSQQASRGNDLKKLKAEYGTQLSTLRELFSTWSDEDLLYALQDADGELELAALRISEGWANQWDEVKGKKTKKETPQKQKPVATTDNQRPAKTERGVPSARGGFGGRGRGSTRGGRPGNFGDRGRGGKSVSGKVNLNSQAITEQDSSVIDSNTWTEATNPASVPTEASNLSSSTAAAQAPTSWASLLKAPPAPEPVKEEPPVEEEKKEIENPVEQEVIAQAVESKPLEEPVVAQSNETETPSPDVVADQVDQMVEVVPELVASTPKQRAPIGRRLRQDVPVVLPGGSTGLGSVGVRFGNLNLDDSEAEIEAEEQLKDDTSSLAAKEPENVAATNASQLADQNNNARPTGVPVQQAYGDSRLSQAPSGLADQAANFGPGFGSNSYTKAEQQQPYGQQQPNQSFGQTTGEQHTNPYSYLPNPNGLSGYGMNPMASVPDYAMYGTEAQRAAMGYYDPTALHHSPSNPPATAYQSRDKYTQDTTNATSQQSGPAAGSNPTVQAQHAYANMPYYPYYYMPNQFQGYQQPGYGQPFVNKNMYPMYQHGNKPNGTSPYAAGGSPYQHHYSPAASYDDMNALHQQQQHGMGQDYQKHYGGGGQPLQNYMGQPSATQGQQGGKNDLNSQYGKSGNGAQTNNAYYNSSTYQNYTQPPHRQPHSQPQAGQPQGGQGTQGQNSQQPYWTQ